MSDLRVAIETLESEREAHELVEAQLRRDLLYTRRLAAVVENTLYHLCDAMSKHDDAKGAQLAGIAIYLLHSTAGCKDPQCGQLSSPLRSIAEDYIKRLRKEGSL